MYAINCVIALKTLHILHTLEQKKEHMKVIEIRQIPVCAFLLINDRAKSFKIIKKTFRVATS